MNAQVQESYLLPGCQMPFCKGCGHSHVLRHLNDALVSLAIPPSQVCLVTDIGCIGLADGLFNSVHTVHTTHGRSTAFATGIELADSILEDSKLKTIVLIGDGGAMIGILHLLNAALLNADVTVLLCNNFLFGMTGGQNSAFSPVDFLTSTTPRGNLVPPVDMCNLARDAHASFVARGFATDRELSGTIARAISAPGFSMVEIIELCTEYATAKNQLSGTALKEVLEKNGQAPGVIVEHSVREEFAASYMKKFPRTVPVDVRLTGSIAPVHAASLPGKAGILIAGSAGERVQSAAAMLCEAAAASSLFSTQKNDNPVTQGSGFSIAEVCLSPREILYTGLEEPDWVIVVSEDGKKEIEGRGVFGNLKHGSRVLIDESINVPVTDAEIIRMPFRKVCGKDRAAFGALMTCLALSGMFPPEAYEQVLKSRSSAGKALLPPDMSSYLSNRQTA